MTKPVVFENLDGGQDTIETTDEHPWWIIGKGWVETKDLSAGMIAKTRDGRGLKIHSSTNMSRIEGTYNISVADYETYFVGDHKLLVHNCTKVSKVNARFQEQPATGGAFSSNNTVKVGDNPGGASPPKLNSETRTPDSDFGGAEAKARLDAASNFDAEFTPVAVIVIGVDRAVKTIKKCISKICGK